MSKFYKKFNDTDECKLFIVSDLHLGHRQNFLWEKRGYKSVEHHNSGVIDIINNTCRPNDILLSLGDFCLNTKYEELENLVRRINCNQFWLSGNHNNPWEKIYWKDCEELRQSTGSEYFSDTFPVEMNGYQLFDTVTVWGPYLEFMWNGQMCTFFHYPISVWNQIQHGAWACCGHSHGSYQLSRHDDFTIKQLDCGWDLHNSPLDFHDIKKIMDKKKFKPKDHHNKDTT